MRAYYGLDRKISKLKDNMNMMYYEVDKNDTLERRLDGLEEENDELKDKLKEKNDKLKNKFETKFDIMEEKIDKLNDKLEVMIHRLEEKNKSLEEVLGRHGS